jgi:HD-like signal output (HDOD) protein
LGALYLEGHNLPDVMVEAARFHHRPDRAVRFPQVVAAVQIADLLARHAKIGTSGDPTKVSAEEWANAPGWNIFLPRQNEAERAVVRSNLTSYLDRLPAILEGLV